MYAQCKSKTRTQLLKVPPPPLSFKILNLEHITNALQACTLANIFNLDFVINDAHLPYNDLSTVKISFSFTFPKVSARANFNLVKKSKYFASL
jgi:hypothetical protein